MNPLPLAARSGALRLLGLWASSAPLCTLTCCREERQVYGEAGVGVLVVQYRAMPPNLEQGFQQCVGPHGPSAESKHF